MNSPHATLHLLPQELAAYLGAGPRANDSTRIREHLAECPECRGEAIEVGRLVRASVRPARVRILAPLALAAGIALVTWVGIRTDSPGTLLRSPATATSQPMALESVSPLGPISRAAGPVTFAWRHAGPAVEYRVTLLDATGAVLWTVLTPDSSAILPVTVSLAPGADYYWYVDALRSDGTSTSSGAQAFRLTP